MKIRVRAGADAQNGAHETDDASANEAAYSEFITQSKINRQQPRTGDFCDQALAGFISQHLGLDSMPAPIPEDL
jgi:hypothetical protein